MKFNLSVFSFIDYVFLIKSSSPLPQPTFWRFFSDVFNKSFIDLCLTLKSVIHFEWIFVEGVRCEIYFEICLSVCMYLFACGCSIVSLPFVEKAIFPSTIAFESLSKISWAYSLTRFLMIYVSIPLPLPHLLNYCSNVINLESG